jgi:hypothetical protein
MQSSDHQYRPPTTLAEATERLDTLTEERLLIQAQLSNKNHLDENGRRLNDHEYHEWRQRATWALSKKTIECRRLKRWIDEHKQEAARIEAGVERPTNVVELVGALVQIIRASAWADMTPREQAVIDLAQNWIRTRGAPAVLAARTAVDGGAS